MTRRGEVSWETPIEADRHPAEERLASDDYDVAWIAELAELAFWQVVAARVPKATTGDLDPLVSHEFRQACEHAIRIWIDSNVVPEAEE